MRVLFLYPQDICYGIVHSCVDNLACALKKEGISVHRFDPKTTPFSNIVYYLRRKYDAVIDFYSGLVSAEDGVGGFFFQNFDSDIYQLCLDYPIFIEDKLNVPLKRHFILCGNERYFPVISSRLPHVSDSFFFPLTGVMGEKNLPISERKRDVTFIGTYNNYRDFLTLLEGVDGDIRLLAEALFETMKGDANLDQTEAMRVTLEKLNISISEDEAYEWFKMIGIMARVAANYHRERMVEAIINAGIKLNVFGESWKKAPFSDNPNLIINPEVKEEEYIDIMSETKVSVNLSYANKSGYTERFGYTMLNSAVCLCDKSDFISENFEDGKDVVFFDLNHPEEIPDKVNEILNNPDRAQSIADSALKKAVAEHTWEERAKLLLEIFKCTKEMV